MIHVPHILHSYIPYTSDIYTVFVSRLLLKILIEPSRKPSFYFDPPHIWVTPCTEKKPTSSVRMGVRCFKTTYPIHIPIPPPPPFFFAIFPSPASHEAPKQPQKVRISLSSPSPCSRRLRSRAGSREQRPRRPPTAPGAARKPYLRCWQMTGG